MPNSHFAGVVPNNESSKASAGSQIRYSTTLAMMGFSIAFAKPAACSGIVALKANINSRNSTNPAVQMSTVRANNRLHG
jgi:membrane-bound ClpP family serine protease